MTAAVTELHDPNMIIQPRQYANVIGCTYVKITFGCLRRSLNMQKWHFALHKEVEANLTLFSDSPVINPPIIIGFMCLFVHQ